jgi:hypothetical protein
MTADSKDRRSRRKIPSDAVKEARRRVGLDQPGAADSDKRSMRAPSVHHSAVRTLKAQAPAVAPVPAAPAHAPAPAPAAVRMNRTMPWQLAQPAPPLPVPYASRTKSLHGIGPALDAALPPAAAAPVAPSPMVSPAVVPASPVILRDAERADATNVAPGQPTRHESDSHRAEPGHVGQVASVDRAAPFAPGVQAAPSVTLSDAVPEVASDIPLTREAALAAVGALHAMCDEPRAEPPAAVSGRGWTVLLVLTTLLGLGLGLAYVGRVGQTSIARGVLQTTEVKAPVAGRVEALLATEAQVVGSGTVIARIVPEGTITNAVVFAPAEDASLLRVGLDANLEFASLPVSESGEIVGRVTSVSNDVASADEIASALGLNLGEPVIRVEIALLPTEQLTRFQGKLRSGERLTARLDSRERRMVTQLFDLLRKWYDR